MCAELQGHLSKVCGAVPEGWGGFVKSVKTPLFMVVSSLGCAKPWQHKRNSQNPVKLSSIDGLRA